MSKYVLAMGGLGSRYSDAVDVFKVTNSDIEHITGHGLTLSKPHYDLAAASCGDYILAMGGMSSASGSGFDDTVDIFKETESGVEHIKDHGLALSEGRCNLAAASCGNYILAMGGESGSNLSNVIDVFQVTPSGAKHITDHGLTLSEGRSSLAAASCGEYIFAMGGNSGTASNVVDVFKLRLA